MAKAVKRHFSASTDGQGILVTAVSSPGTLIHTAPAGAVDGSYDEVWLWAYNNDTVNTTIYVEYGASGLARKVLIDAQQGLVPVLPGILLRNGKTVKVYCPTTGIVMIDGFVNRITD